MAEPDELGENVEFFTGATPNNYDPKVMLAGAMRVDLDSVVILGWDKDDNLFISSSDSSKPEILWLIEKAKHALLTAGEE